MVSIQSSYTFPSKCRCSSPSRNLVSCSSLTSWLCSLNCLSYGDVIYGTSYFYSFACLSCGDVICDTFVICLVACTTVGTTCTTIGTEDGSTLPLIIFYAHTYVLSCSLFNLEPEALPSSTLFFLLIALLGESIATFFIFSNAIYISSLVILTLTNGFYGFSFCQYQGKLTNIFLIPLIFLNILIPPI